MGTGTLHAELYQHTRKRNTANNGCSAELGTRYLMIINFQKEPSICQKKSDIFLRLHQFGRFYGGLAILPAHKLLLRLAQI